MYTEPLYHLALRLGRKPQFSVDSRFIYAVLAGSYYVNVSVLINFSKKTSVLTLIIMFSIKSYVLDVNKNRLGEAILIHIQNI